jgi:tetratricopeptide (TPR) repeat protein
MSTWTIKQVIVQLAGSALAKSVLEKELASNEGTSRFVIRGIRDQWEGRFREKFIVRQGIAWQADRAVTAIRSPETDPDIETAFEAAFVNHILEQHINMVSEFLDTLGIAHKEGSFQEEQVTDFDETDVAQAVEKISETYPLADVRLYLAVAGIRMEFWSNSLWAALDRILDDETPSPEVESPESTELVPDAVIPMHSTVLDNLMTKAIIESIGGEGGSLGVNFIEDAIDELITMDLSRHQSYFHRGYFHALVRTKDRTPSLEDNEPRRRWELVGEVFGLARLSDPEMLIACWSENSTELVRLMTERHPAGPRVLPVLFRALWDAKLHSDALGLLRPEVVATCTSEFKGELLSTARSHRLQGLVDDARTILDALDSAVQIGDGEERHYVSELYRERAVCMRTQGHFEDAVSLLEAMLEDSPQEMEGDLEGLMGLCKANFRRVSEVTYLVSADQVNTMKERLSEQSDHFQKASNSDLSLAVAIGSHCLGILAFLEGDAEQASILLSKAYSAALRSAQTNINAAFIAQVQISLAIAIVTAADETRFHQASELLGSVNNDKLIIPEWIASRTIDNAVLIPDESVRGEILIALVGYSPDSREHLLAQTSEATHLVPVGIVSEVVNAINATSTDMVSRWNYSGWLALRHVADGDFESASRCLDMLESMAFERQRFREPFIELLAADGKYDGAWSTEDIAWSLVGIHEREADYEGAVGVLRKQFHTYAAEESWLEAFGVFERAKNYGLPAKILEDMEGRLTGEFASTDLPPGEELDELITEPVRVLFVGGNEIQQKYDADIQKNLATSAPWISVDFEHPGWGGNWGDTADQLRSRFPNYDALVVMTLIRTNLGRALRKHTNNEGLVWVSCTGAGRNFIERSIMDGAALAVKKRRNGSA